MPIEQPKFEPAEDKPEEKKIEIVTPIGANERKISPEEIKKSKRLIEELKEEKIIKEKKQKGELLSQAETAKLRELEIARHSNKEISRAAEEKVKEVQEEKVEAEQKTEAEERVSEAAVLKKNREEYAGAYNEYVNKFGKIKRVASEEQGEAFRNVELKKAEYEKAKEDFGKKMFVEGAKPAEIFKKLILEERENLDKAKVESWPPVKKKAWRKGVEWWMKQKPSVRLLVSTTIVTGAVAASGGFAAVGLGGVAFFAGQRYAKGFLSVGAGQLAGRGVERVMSKGIEAKRAAAMEKLKTEFSLEKLKEAEKEYQKILEETAKAERKKLYIKAGAMIAAGAGTAIGLGMLEHVYAGGVKAPVPESPAKPATITPEAPNAEIPPKISGAPVPEAPPKIPLIELRPIGARGPEGAIIDYLKNNPDSAKRFGWDGKADLSEWSGVKAHELWLEDAKEALVKPETLEQLKKLGYSQDIDGYEQMMRSVGRGFVELDSQKGEINLVDTEYLKARVSPEAVAPAIPSEIAPEAHTKIASEEAWEKALGVEPPAEVAEIGRGAITKTLYENFGMGADLYDKFSGMKLREFLALKTGSGMPFTSDLPWEGYNYVQIGDLQKAMRRFYLGLSSVEQMSANNAPAGEFIKQNFDKLFPQK